MSRTYVELRKKCFLDPELFQRHLSATLYLFLEFTHFLLLDLYGAFCASVPPGYFSFSSPLAFSVRQ